MRLTEIYKQILSEQVYDVYHGSDVEIKNFDLNKTASNVAWFSDSIENIQTGESGADSTKYIMKFQVKLENPAGWDEYDRYSIDELINDGYDGVILPEIDHKTFIVFDERSIKYIKTVKK